MPQPERDLHLGALTEPSVLAWLRSWQLLVGDTAGFDDASCFFEAST